MLTDEARDQRSGKQCLESGASGNAKCADQARGIQRNTRDEQIERQGTQRDTEPGAPPAAEHDGYRETCRREHRARVSGGNGKGDPGPTETEIS